MEDDKIKIDDDTKRLMLRVAMSRDMMWMRWLAIFVDGFRLLDDAITERNAEVSAHIFNRIQYELEKIRKSSVESLKEAAKILDSGDMSKVSVTSLTDLDFDNA